MTIAVILAGGLGTRLRSVVPDLPKPMAPVGERPFLEHLLDYWISQGVTKFILSIGYKKKLIVNHFGFSYKQIPITYVEEDEPLGTGGGFVLAAHDQKSNFLLLNGDTYFEVPLNELINFHKENKADWTIALFRANQANRYGSICMDDTDRIKRIKTAKSEIGEFANGGVYYVNSQALGELKLRPGGKYSLEDEILKNLINAGKTVMGFKRTGKFLDIGIPADYDIASNIIGSEGN